MKTDGGCNFWNVFCVIVLFDVYLGQAYAPFAGQDGSRESNAENIFVKVSPSTEQSGIVSIFHSSITDKPTVSASKARGIFFSYRIICISFVFIFIPPRVPVLCLHRNYIKKTPLLSTKTGRHNSVITDSLHLISSLSGNILHYTEGRCRWNFSKRKYLVVHLMTYTTLIQQRIHPSNDKRILYIPVKQIRQAFAYLISPMTDV